MIDVALVNPRTSLQNSLSQTDSDRKFIREPPTGLMILAAILENKGYTVEIIDCSIYNNPFEHLRKQAENYRLFGLTCLTNTYYQAIQLAKTAKRFNPASYIIMGGPHVSFQYKETFQDMRFLDAVCIGEAENSFPRLVDLFLEHSVVEALYDGVDLSHTINTFGKTAQLLNRTALPKGIAYPNHIYADGFTKVVYNLGPEISEKIKNVSIKTSGLPDPVEIDRIPLPARHLIRAYNVADVIINRGCPNNCSFCSRTKLFPTVRIRSIPNVMEELDHILSMPSYRFVNFYDNINLNKAYFYEFLDALKEHKFRLPWGAELRADALEERQVEKMAHCNCKIIATGVESAAIEVLRTNAKHQNPQKVAKSIALLKAYDIAVQAYFVLGLPGETKDTFQETLEYIRNLPLEKGIDKIEIFPATPYPGSDLHSHQEAYHLKIVNENFNMYNCKEIIIETDSLTYEEISKMLDMARSLKNELGL